MKGAINAQQSAHHSLQFNNKITLGLPLLMLLERTACNNQVFALSQVLTRVLAALQEEQL